MRNIARSAVHCGADMITYMLVGLARGRAVPVGVGSRCEFTGLPSLAKLCVPLLCSSHQNISYTRLYAAACA